LLSLVPRKCYQKRRLFPHMSARKTRLLIKVSDFYWGLHGKGLKKGGGTLFTSDGQFNSAGCMDSLFAPVNGSMTKSNATAMVRLRLCVHRWHSWQPPCERGPNFSLLLSLQRWVEPSRLTYPFVSRAAPSRSEDPLKSSITTCVLTFRCTLTCRHFTLTFHRWETFGGLQCDSG